MGLDGEATADPSKELPTVTAAPFTKSRRVIPEDIPSFRSCESCPILAILRACYTLAAQIIARWPWSSLILPVDEVAGKAKPRHEATGYPEKIVLDVLGDPAAANDASQSDESSPKQRERSRLWHGKSYASSIIPPVVIAAFRMLVS